MEISGNSINQPVNFYTKNTGNTINMAIDENKLPLANNIFMPELVTEKALKNITQPRKKRKSKRFNALDSEYLPDEPSEKETTNEIQETDNFFISGNQNNIKENIKTGIEHFVTNTPLINYFFMRKKEQNIKKAVETLNDISQNVDELLNTAVPYGEETDVYNDIANNLTKAVNILGNANKNL